MSVVVEEVRPGDRKITLGFGGEPKEPREHPGEWKKYAKPQPSGGGSGGFGGSGGAMVTSGGGGLNLLGDKLREAMAAKKK